MVEHPSLIRDVFSIGGLILVEVWRGRRLAQQRLLILHDTPGAAPAPGLAAAVEAGVDKALGAHCQLVIGIA